MEFVKLQLKIKYRTFVDDPINDFYIPVLSKSVAYNRAVGYFSSSILVDYAKGLRQFLKNDGIIKLIISPYLSLQDISSINYAYSEEVTIEKTNEMFESYLTDEISFASAKLLFLLIKLGKLEIRVAEPQNANGLFHDKIGIFYDDAGNKIAIIGSNNESSSALNSNVESFNTFCSWKLGQAEYVTQHEYDFNGYWEGKNNTIKLYSLEEALDGDIFIEFNTDETIDELFDKIEEIKENDTYEKWSVTPYPFQKSAVDSWFENRKGIFKFATGAGKTKTSIYLMEKLEKENDKNFFVIVVPDKTLVNQWSEELESYDKKVLRCYSANPNWQNELKDLIEISGIKEEYQYYIVVTNDSFSGKKFKRELNKLNNDYLFVVDECHTWGTLNFLNNLPNPKMRLGLSATPELFFSEERTKKLLSFFGGIIAEYSLADATRDKLLVRYEYYPHFVSLTPEEKENYDELTKKIVSLYGYDPVDINDKLSRHEKSEMIEMLLFSRARIIYGAANKINRLADIVMDLAEQKNLIVYCGPTSYSIQTDDDTEKDSLTQLEAVNKLLGQLGLKFAQYTSKESESERKHALQSFTSGDYSTLVAIKCLDEGINIPQIERAIIMASSTNPREFVQRRGRILRTYPGKESSEIHDFVVFDDEYKSLGIKEMTRVAEFLDLASNKDEIIENFDKNQKELYLEVISNEKQT